MASRPASDISANPHYGVQSATRFPDSPFGVAKCRLRVSCNLFRGFVGALEALRAMVSARFSSPGRIDCEGPDRSVFLGFRHSLGKRVRVAPRDSYSGS